MRRRLIPAVLLTLTVGHLATQALDATEDTVRGHGKWNIPMKTLGGKQFWGDVTFYGGWHIQRNIFTGHYRLLDPDDVRRAWGEYGACKAALEDAKAKGDATLTSRKLCLLVHGFLRSKDSFTSIRVALEQAGYEVYSVNYPSSRFDIDVFAKQVRQVIEQAVKDFDEVNLVTHSMGGIIARRVLSADDAPKVDHLVMIAPPNQGAVMADLLLDWWPSEYVTGPSGKQLATGVESFSKNAGIPQCPFGIIAGARGDDSGWNPLIPGDDDGVVGLDNTRMDNANGFVVVKALHTVIMNNEKTIQQVLHFLREGVFEEEGGE